jgi:glycogen debranching enzyme
MYPQVDPNRKSNLRLEVEGELVEVMLETRLVKSGDETPFAMSPDIINGLKNFKTDVRERIPIEKSKMARLSPSSHAKKTVIEFTDLRPGSAIAFMFNLQPDQDAACVRLRKMLGEKDDRLDQICDNLRLSHM